MPAGVCEECPVGLVAELESVPGEDEGAAEMVQVPFEHGGESVRRDPCERAAQASR
jgi:hypothetical protein